VDSSGVSNNEPLDFSRGSASWRADFAPRSHKELEMGFPAGGTFYVPEADLRQGRQPASQVPWRLAGMSLWLKPLAENPYLRFIRTTIAWSVELAGGLEPSTC